MNIKPKVFLSHSSLDKTFINKISSDLKRCQIDTWLDTDEIRDGKPWKEAIFIHGIPECDVVLVYLTMNSINSKMVKKEMDTALVKKLKGFGVIFLPYVSQSSIRSKLKAKVQSLQCREWNDANYSDVFPTIVAEIWKSYLEKKVSEVHSEEENKHMELEKDIINLKAKLFDYMKEAGELDTP